MNKFPKTLAALKEVCLEATEDHAASCSAYWAVGDALLEECGPDPTWDEDWFKRSFKGGSQLRAAEDWLAENGMNEFSAYDLLEYRETSQKYPPPTRRMNITYCAHIQSDDPERIARWSASLEPGEIGYTVEEDLEALKKYGPC